MMGDMLLQGGAYCDTSMAGIDYVRDFAFLKAIACTYASIAGLAVVGLFVYGAVSLSIYIRTGSTLIPMVLLLLTGGAVLPAVASPGVSIAVVMLLTTGAGAFAVLYYKYSQ